MKIILSSTYVDLIEYRQAAAEALERLGQQVGRMEIFGARPVEPCDACLSDIEGCDLFVGIYAHRYGHIPDGSAVSITEAEFRHARKHNKPVFCFVVEDHHPWPPAMIESEPGRAKLIALKAAISSGFVRDTFTTPENLAYKIATSVGHYLTHPSYRKEKFEGQLQQGPDTPFDKIEALMPKLLGEMREDLAQYPLRREFVLLKRAWSYWARGDELMYYYDDHLELRNQIRILENYRLVEDITYNNVDRFVITEKLAEHLLTA